jgi:hypothetical protein
MNSVPTQPHNRNGKAAAPPRNGVLCAIRKSWGVRRGVDGLKQIVEESIDGHFNILDFAMLTLDELRRVHAVLGFILADNPEEEGPPPPF